MSRPTKSSNDNSRSPAASDPDGGIGLDPAEFLQVVAKFIDVANRENRTVAATELQMAFLYAAARYNAYVAKDVLLASDQEAFIADMAGMYADALRQHLADPNLGRM